MPIPRPEWPKIILGALLFAAVFMTVSYFARANQGALEALVEAGGAGGIAALIALQALFTVFFVPLDSSVLVPLATHAWGPWQTAVMSIAGWTLGSAIAFAIAKRYGQPVVERLVSAERVREARQRAPQRHLFWWVVGVQALVQVDFVSYMFGLFAAIPLGEYALATAIGDILPAFFFSYAGTLPVWYQGAAVLAGLTLTGLLFWRFTRRVR